MYDPRFNIDGKNLPVVIPPAFGLRRVDREIYTGDGPVSYWNEYVAVTQMHGHGRFEDPRIGVSIDNPPDLVSRKLRPLADLPVQPGEAGAARGQIRCRRGGARPPGLQRGRGMCGSVTRGPLYTDVNSGILHFPREVGQDRAYAQRSATKRYRTTPLRASGTRPS